MILNMSGGGGASLNFKVIGGTSQPSSAAENTIWIDTSAAITSYIFSATEPENPAAGMVWISVGTSSGVAFSATKKNPVMVYPISAKQYVGGAWVDKTAKIYQGGEWFDWVTYLFNKGDECTARTGGWSGAWTNANGCLSVTASGNSTRYIQTTANKVNLTNAKTLTIKYEVTQIDGLLQTSMRFGITSTKPSGTASAQPSFVGVVICDETKQEATLTIETQGEYYVVISAAGANTTKTNVYEVIMD